MKYALIESSKWRYDRPVEAVFHGIYTKEECQKIIKERYDEEKYDNEYNWYFNEYREGDLMLTTGCPSDNEYIGWTLQALLVVGEE